MPTRPSTAQDSPNACLREFLLKFFAEGPHLAALRYYICSRAIKMPLVPVVRGGPLTLAPSLPKEDDLHAIVNAHTNDHFFVNTLAAQNPWENSKRSAEFVTLLCADLEQLDSRVRAAAFNSRKLGGTPSTTQVRLEPTSDLPAALAKAIAVQRAGDAGRAAMGITVASSSTAIAVTLADCNMLRAEEQLNPSAARFVSYTHRFVLLVDGSGVGLYQAWGPGTSSTASASASASSTLSSGGVIASSTSPAMNGGDNGGGGGGGGGYTLQDWLQRSLAPMSYEQAADFARTLQDFCERIHLDDATNQMYEQLFGVNLRAVAEARGLALPGRIRSWLGILELPYVTANRVRSNTRLFM